jgi:hypothetical protein
MFPVEEGFASPEHDETGRAIVGGAPYHLIKLKPPRLGKESRFP